MTTTIKHATPQAIVTVSFGQRKWAQEAFLAALTSLSDSLIKYRKGWIELLLAISLPTQHFLIMDSQMTGLQRSDKVVSMRSM
jgi:hypothetical protein